MNRWHRNISVARWGESHMNIPWDKDPRAVRFIQEHPEGGEFKEIAEALGVHINTVKSAYQNAKDKLNRRPWARSWVADLVADRPDGLMYPDHEWCDDND